MTSYQSIETPQDYVNYTFNITSRGVTEVAGEMAGLSNTVTTILGQLAFKTAEYLTHTETLMMGMGTVAVSSFASATQEAMKFEQAIANVQAIGGESINAMDIGKAAMQYSSQFAMDVNSMTEGLEALSRAGLTATNVMSGVLAEGVKLSKLEGMDLEDSINDLIATTNLLSEEGFDVNSQEYADAVKAMNQHIVSTSESAPINAQNIIQTLQHVGGYASANKIDQDDLFAVIAQLGSKGTKGEMAGTALRAFIAAGQKDQAQRALARIGLDVSDLWDASGNAMLPVSEMKQVLDDALETRGYSQQEKLEFYSDFAGYKQANQIMKIDVKDVQQYKDTIAQAWDLGKKLDTILGTTHNNLQSLFQTVKNFMTRVGETTLPIINAIVLPMKWGVQLLEAMPFSENIVGMLLAFAGLKAAILFINRVVPSIASLYTTFSQSEERAKGISGHFHNMYQDLVKSKEILSNITNKDYLNKQRLKEGFMGRQSYLQHKDITRIIYEQHYQPDHDDKLPWKELSTTQKELYYSIAETLKSTQLYKNVDEALKESNQPHLEGFSNVLLGKVNVTNVHVDDVEKPKSNLVQNKEERQYKNNNKYDNKDNKEFAVKEAVEQAFHNIDINDKILDNLQEGTQYDIGKSILSIKEPLAEAIGRAVAQSLNTKEVVVSDALGSFQIDGRKASSAIKQLQNIESDVSVDLGDIGFFLDYDLDKIDSLMAKVRGDLQQKITSYQNDNPMFMNDTQRLRMEKIISGAAKTNLGKIYSTEQNSIDILDVLKYGKVKDYKSNKIGIHEKQMDAIEAKIGMGNQSGLERSERLTNIHNFLQNKPISKKQKDVLIRDVLKITEDIWKKQISHDNPGVEASKFLTSDIARYIGNTVGIGGINWNQIENPTQQLIEYFKNTKPNSYKDRQLKQADRLMLTFMEGAKAQGEIFNAAEAQEIGYLIRRYKQLLLARNKKIEENQTSSDSSSNQQQSLNKEINASHINTQDFSNLQSNIDIDYPYTDKQYLAFIYDEISLLPGHVKSILDDLYNINYNIVDIRHIIKDAISNININTPPKHQALYNPRVIATVENTADRIKEFLNMVNIDMSQDIQSIGASNAYGDVFINPKEIENTIGDGSNSIMHKMLDTYTHEAGHVLLHHLDRKANGMYDDIDKNAFNYLGYNAHSVIGELETSIFSSTLLGYYGIPTPELTQERIADMTQILSDNNALQYVQYDMVQELAAQAFNNKEFFIPLLKSLISDGDFNFNDLLSTDSFNDMIKVMGNDISPYIDIWREYHTASIEDILDSSTDILDNVSDIKIFESKMNLEYEKSFDMKDIRDWVIGQVVNFEDTTWGENYDKQQKQVNAQEKTLNLTDEQKSAYGEYVAGRYENIKGFLSGKDPKTFWDDATFDEVYNTPLNSGLTAKEAALILLPLMQQTPGLLEDSILWHGGELNTYNNGIGFLPDIRSLSYNEDIAKHFMRIHPERYEIKVYAPAGTPGLIPADDFGDFHADEEEYTIPPSMYFELVRDDINRYAEIFIIPFEKIKEVLDNVDFSQLELLENYWDTSSMKKFLNSMYIVFDEEMSNIGESTGDEIRINPNLIAKYAQQGNFKSLPQGIFEVYTHEAAHNMLMHNQRTSEQMRNASSYIPELDFEYKGYTGQELIAEFEADSVIREVQKAQKIKPSKIIKQRWDAIKQVLEKNNAMQYVNTDMVNKVSTEMLSFSREFKSEIQSALFEESRKLLGDTSSFTNSDASLEDKQKAIQYSEAGTHMPTFAMKDIEGVDDFFKKVKSTVKTVHEAYTEINNAKNKFQFEEDIEAKEEFATRTSSVSAPVGDIIKEAFQDAETINSNKKRYDKTSTHFSTETKSMFGDLSKHRISSEKYKDDLKKMDESSNINQRTFAFSWVDDGGMYDPTELVREVADAIEAGFTDIDIDFKNDDIVQINENVQKLTNFFTEKDNEDEDIPLENLNEEAFNKLSENIGNTITANILQMINNARENNGQPQSLEPPSDIIDVRTVEDSVKDAIKDATSIRPDLASKAAYQHMSAHSDLPTVVNASIIPVDDIYTLDDVLESIIKLVKTTKILEQTNIGLTSAISNTIVGIMSLYSVFLMIPNIFTSMMSEMPWRPVALEMTARTFQMPEVEDMDTFTLAKHRIKQKELDEDEYSQLIDELEPLFGEALDVRKVVEPIIKTVQEVIDMNELIYRIVTSQLVINPSIVTIPSAPYNLPTPIYPQTDDYIDTVAKDVRDAQNIQTSWVTDPKEARDMVYGRNGKHPAMITEENLQELGLDWLIPGWKAMLKQSQTIPVYPEDISELGPNNKPTWITDKAEANRIINSANPELITEKNIRSLFTDDKSGKYDVEDLVATWKTNMKIYGRIASRELSESQMMPSVLTSAMKTIIYQFNKYLNDATALYITKYFDQTFLEVDALLDEVLQQREENIKNTLNTIKKISKVNAAETKRPIDEDEVNIINIPPKKYTTVDNSGNSFAHDTAIGLVKNQEAYMEFEGYEVGGVSTEELERARSVAYINDKPKTKKSKDSPKKPTIPSKETISLWDFGAIPEEVKERYRKQYEAIYWEDASQVPDYVLDILGWQSAEGKEAERKRIKEANMRARDVGIQKQIKEQQEKNAKQNQEDILNLGNFPTFMWDEGYKKAQEKHAKEMEEDKERERRLAHVKDDVDALTKGQEEANAQIDKEYNKKRVQADIDSLNTKVKEAEAQEALKERIENTISTMRVFVSGFDDLTKTLMDKKIERIKNQLERGASQDVLISTLKEITNLAEEGYERKQAADALSPLFEGAPSQEEQQAKKDLAVLFTETPEHAQARKDELEIINAQKALAMLFIDTPEVAARREKDRIAEENLKIAKEIGEVLGPQLLETMKHQIQTTQEQITALEGSANADTISEEERKKIYNQHSHIQGVKVNPEYEGLSKYDKERMKLDHKYGKEFVDTNTSTSRSLGPQTDIDNDDIYVRAQVKREQSLSERVQRWSIDARERIDNLAGESINKIGDILNVNEGSENNDGFQKASNKISDITDKLIPFNQALFKAGEMFPPFTIAAISMQKGMEGLTIASKALWFADQLRLVLLGQEHAATEGSIAAKILDIAATWAATHAEESLTAARIIGTVQQTIKNGLEKVLGLVTSFVSSSLFLPVMAILAAIVAAIIAVKFWEGQHAKALKESQKALEEATAKNNVALSQYKDLKKARENETDAMKKQQLARKEAIALYELEAARIKKRKAVHDEAKLRNDSVWGEYGLRASLQKMGLGIIAGGDFESQYEKYDGTTANIRQIKENTLGNLFASREQSYVASVYDRNSTFFAEVEAYKEPLQELYDKESKLIEQYGSIDLARGSKEFQEAVQEFADATGINGETAAKMLDWLDTENKVNQATKVGQAQIGVIRARADAKVAALEYGEGGDLNDMDNLGNAMVLAQFQEMMNTAKTEVWWELLFAYLDTFISIMLPWKWGDVGKNLAKVGIRQEELAELDAEGNNILNSMYEQYENADRRDYGNGVSYTADTPFGGAISSAATMYAEDEQQMLFNSTGQTMSEGAYSAIQEQYAEDTFGVTEEGLKQQKAKEDEEAYRKAQEAKDNKADTTLGQLQNNGEQAHEDAMAIVDAIKNPGVVSGIGAGVGKIFDDSLFKSLGEFSLDDLFAFMRGEEGTFTGRAKDIFKGARNAYKEGGFRGVYQYGKQGVKNVGNRALNFLDDLGINARPYAEKGISKIKGVSANAVSRAENAIARGKSIVTEGIGGIRNLGSAEARSALGAKLGSGLRDIGVRGKDLVSRGINKVRGMSPNAVSRAENAMARGKDIVTEGIDGIKSSKLFEGAKAAYADDGLKGLANFGKEAGKDGIRGLAQVGKTASSGAGGVRGFVSSVSGEVGGMRGLASGTASTMKAAFSPSMLKGGISNIAKGLRGGGTLMRGIGTVGSTALMALGPALAFADKASELNPFEGKHYNEDGTEKKALQATGEVLGTTAGAVGGVAGGIAGADVGAAAGAAIGTAILPGVGTVIGGALGSVVGGIAGGWLGDTIFQPIGDAIGGTIGWLGDNLLGGIQSVAGTVWDGLTGAAGGVWDAVTGAAGGVWDFLTGGNKGNQPVGGLLALTPIGMAINAAVGISDWLSGKGGENDPYQDLKSQGKEAGEKARHKSENTIIIKNININTEDDPEKIKSALMNLIIEMQEQIAPRTVSRTVGEPPAQSTSTSQNENNESQAEGTDEQSGTQNNINNNTNTTM